jgi:cytoskeletal protein RodZ
MNKNTQSGFIIPLIIGIVALFIIAGGVYFAYEKGKSAEVNQVNTSVIPAQAGIQSQTSGSNSSTSTSTEPTPIITSINPTSAKIGDTVAVSGSNLRGFEGDKNLWIQNVSSGVKGIIHGDAGASDQSIKFNLTDKYCTAETSYSGNACPSYLTITPGNYVVYANPWGVTSNSVPLLITSTSSTAWQTYTNSQYGFSFQYPASYGNLSTLNDNIIALGQASTNGEGFNANFSVNMPRVLLNNSGQPKTLTDLTNYYNVKGNTESTVTVGGIQSLEVWSSQIGTMVFVPLSGSKFIEIIGDHNNPIFNQILSTFTFTNN